MDDMHVRDFLDMSHRQAMEAVGWYIDMHIHHIAEKTYRSLVQADRRVDYEKIRACVRHDFYRFYSMAAAVDNLFGKDRCEAERARAVLNAIEEHAIFMYSRNMEMTAH